VAAGNGRGLWVCHPPPRRLQSGLPPQPVGEVPAQGLALGRCRKKRLRL